MLAVRTLGVALVFGLCVALPKVAQAQERTRHTDGFHMGIGASLNLIPPLVISGGGGGAIFSSPGLLPGGGIHLPMDIVGVLRIEPGISFFHYGDDDNAGTERSDVIQPEIGAFYLFGVSPQMMFSVGGRLSPTFVSSTTVTGGVPPAGPNELDRSRLDWAVAPAFGGEYFFSKHFSLGAEARFEFIFQGEEDLDPGGTGADSSFVFRSNAVVFARAFFL